ncbi:phosphoribosylanthranilate isomerase [Epibacterium sp. Ofav1-8]|uniref:phosphoribosylanthranilate isomerase n=1 Tax=Epibacterium sp. Ofav1-8 TaxID=2917735 RepID=UPI001EF6A825|nr:phosphoribosylanthranilate isomerase [Epibacterium sp. Ofav1-8]MCG7622134.1 phosphoribosylanthranilate isomerase [Epibacterium sp. Ofav1-8]
MSGIRVKICGMKTRADMEAAAAAGAAYVGLNFFSKSARSVTIAQAAALAVDAPVGLAKVGLVVNPTDADLDAIAGSVPLDMIQLHGRESVERVAEIKTRYGLPVMKVIGVAEASDLAPIDLYAQVADQIMIDAKAPKGAKLPGGNGIAFDWQLLADKKYWQAPWMLAGGLTPGNVAEAIRKTGARQVDVASGVESAPAQKDPDLMRAFVDATQAV